MNRRPPKGGASLPAGSFALCPGRVEPLLDGLYKTYRLHKWLGIALAVLMAGGSVAAVVSLSERVGHQH